MNIECLSFAQMEILTLVMNYDMAIRKKEYRCFNLPLSSEMKLDYPDANGHDYRPKTSNCVTVHIHAQNCGHAGAEVCFVYGPHEKHLFTLTGDSMFEAIYSQHVGK